MIPVFMKEDLVPIIGEENMVQELPAAFNDVLVRAGRPEDVCPALTAKE